MIRWSALVLASISFALAANNYIESGLPAYASSGAASRFGSASRSRPPSTPGPVAVNYDSLRDQLSNDELDGIYRMYPEFSAELEKYLGPASSSALKMPTMDSIKQSAMQLRDEMQSYVDSGKKEAITLIDCIYENLKQQAEMMKLNANAFKQGIYATVRWLKNNVVDFTQQLNKAQIMDKNNKNNKNNNNHKNNGGKTKPPMNATGEAEYFDYYEHFNLTKPTSKG